MSPSMIDDVRVSDSEGNLLPVPLLGRAAQESGQVRDIDVYRSVRGRVILSGVSHRILRVASARRSRHRADTPNPAEAS